MTGIGIIGTFGGLLIGLSAFDPAGDPANVQNSLALLLHGVRDAFIASGVAIALAMLTIAAEKTLLKECFSQLEKLNTAIDGLFDADQLGEEYLEQLVRSAEANATQTKQLKDGLVEDLKLMMDRLTSAQRESQQELAHRLIEASTQNSRELAVQISQSITDSLQNPLEKIADSVKKVSGDQGSAVQDLLTDVLTSFMDQFKSSFGNQMNDMSGLMNQSVSAMREMQQVFSKLIEDTRHTNETSTQVLEQKIVQMLSDIQSKQQEMGATMNGVLDQVQQSVERISNTGAEATQKMHQQVGLLVSKMEDNLSGMMQDLSEKRAEQDKISLETQEKISAYSSSAVDAISQQTSEMLKQMNDNIISMMNDVQSKRIEQDNLAIESQKQLHHSTNSAFSQIAHQTDGFINKMGESMSGLLLDIENRRVEQDQLVIENQQKLHENMTTMLNSLALQFDRLLDESRLAIQGYRQNIDMINQVSTNSINGMIEGADKIRTAADQFGSAGINLSVAIQGGSDLLSKVNLLTDNFSQTTTQLRDIVIDYKHSQQAVAQSISVLESLIEKAQQEAGLNSKMLEDMRSLTDSLQTVRQNMQLYIEQVDDALTSAFSTFSDATESSLSRSLNSFDNTLDQAVKHLLSGIEGLGEAAEDLAELAQRNARRS
jgi:putative membrane protein